MKKSINALKPLGVITLAVVVLGVAGCQSTSDRSLAQQWGDSQVASLVKKELGKDPFYRYPDVHPVVYEGTVQLTGFVENAEQRQRAAELAARSIGVRQVVNCIALKPAPEVVEQFPTNAPATVMPAAEPVRAPAAPPQRTPATYQVPTQGAGAAQQLGR